MGGRNEAGNADGALSDPRQRYVRSTICLLLAVAALASASAAVLHALQPAGQLVNKLLPLLMALGFGLVLIRYWRHPERLRSTVWLGWLVAVGGLAAPSWIFVLAAWGGARSLVDSLPPITAVLLPLLLAMVVFARPRFAWMACAGAWLMIAAPVLLYLIAHPQQLWTPRGLDLAIAFGPASMFIPLLIPLLRGVEQRIETLQQDGERLQSLAERDVLVGLYNRRAAEQRLSGLMAHADAPLAVLLFDVDRFKQVNDQFGHAAGDAVLIEIGRRCSVLLRDADVFARWGGEEFLVVMPGADAADGERLAQRLRTAIRAGPISPVGDVSASFGVSVRWTDDTLAQLLQRADEALYRAKANGRDRVEVARS